MAAIAAARAPADLAVPLLAEIAGDWEHRARDEQKPPPGDWRTWLMLGGRGSGKTRAGAEWVHARRDATPAGPASALRIALVARDAGRRPRGHGRRPLRHLPDRPPQPSVLRGLAPPARLAERRGRPRLLLGGPGKPARPAVRRRLVRRTRQVDARRRRPGTCCSSACGSAEHPRQLVTTTPRPMPLHQGDPARDPDTAVTRIRTADNARQPRAGLPRGGGGALRRHPPRPPGTRRRVDRGPRGRALARAPTSSGCGCGEPGPVGRIVVAVDPPAAAEARNSCCGIVAAGLGADGTRRGARRRDAARLQARAAWAAPAIRLYRRFDADGWSPRSTRAATWWPR